VGETNHGLASDRVQFVVCYVTVFPVEPVFIRAVRRHYVQALKTESFGHVGGHQREFLDDDLILAYPLKFEIYKNLHIS